MITVVEGVDASGKSTLLENIRAIPHLYFVLLRHSCRPLRPYDILRFLRLANDSPIPMVIDRHPLISEPIYGPILRGVDLVSEIFTPGQVQRKLEATVNRIVYCRPPLELIRRNLSNRPQLSGVAEKIEPLLEAYDKRMSELAQVLPVISYDYCADVVDYRNLIFGDGP